MTAAAATTPADPAALDVRLLPVALMQPSPTNPRRHFDDAALRELAASIRRHGVLHPVMVRPIAGRTGADGRALYEVIAGERRWRAALLAEVGCVPALVRTDLGDMDVLELQLIENLQRSDLHPLDEAQGYERMLLDPPWWVTGGSAAPPRLRGYTVDELAARVGRRSEHVRARLRLLALGQPARAAFFEGLIGVGSALTIAHLREADQAELVQALRHDAERGAAWTHDTVVHQAQNRYMLRLAGVPWDLHDATLLPEAGACSACPRRSGASPELFDDIADADRCTDPGCFAAKRAAHHQRQLATARDAGAKIVTSPDAEALWPTRAATIKGHLRLDMPSEYQRDRRQPLGQVLRAAYPGKPLPGLVLIDRAAFAAGAGAGGEERITLEVIPTAQARKLLAAKGLLRDDADAAIAAKPAAQPAADGTAHADDAARSQRKAEETGEVATGPTGHPAFDAYIHSEAFPVIPATIARKLQPEEIDRWAARTRDMVTVAQIAHRARFPQAGGRALISPKLARLLLLVDAEVNVIDPPLLWLAAGVDEPAYSGFPSLQAMRKRMLALDDHDACAAVHALLASRATEEFVEPYVTENLALLAEAMGIAHELPDMRARSAALVDERLRLELLQRASTAEQAKPARRRARKA